MQWKKLAKEEADGLKFQEPKGGASSYAELVAEVRAGNAVKVDLEEGKRLSSLKWSLGKAFERAGVPVELKALADRSAIVASPPKKPAPIQTEIPVPPQPKKQSQEPPK